METILFEPVKEDHLRALANILNFYIEHTTVSFHTQCLQASDLREKVFFSQPAFQAFTLIQNEEIVGFCVVSPWKKQQAYRHTGEVSIYLSHEYTGKGIGSTAIAHMISHAQANGIHVLIAGLCSENQQSKMLFEKSGFELCAHFKGVGKKFGRVLDTIYLQKTV